MYVLKLRMLTCIRGTGEIKLLVARDSHNFLICIGGTGEIKLLVRKRQSLLPHFMIYFLYTFSFYSLSPSFFILAATIALEVHIFYCNAEWNLVFFKMRNGL